MTEKAIRKGSFVKIREPDNINAYQAARYAGWNGTDPCKVHSVNDNIALLHWPDGEEIQEISLPVTFLARVLPPPPTSKAIH